MNLTNEYQSSLQSNDNGLWELWYRSCWLWLEGGRMSACSIRADSNSSSTSSSRAALRSWPGPVDWSDGNEDRFASKICTSVACLSIPPAHSLIHKLALRNLCEAIHRIFGPKLCRPCDTRKRNRHCC